MAKEIFEPDPRLVDATRGRLETLPPEKQRLYDPNLVAKGAQRSFDYIRQQGVENLDDYKNYLLRKAEEHNAFVPDLKYDWQDEFESAIPEFWDWALQHNIPVSFIQDDMKVGGGLQHFGADNRIGFETDELLNLFLKQVRGLKDEEPERKTMGRQRRLYIPSMHGNPAISGLSADEILDLNPEDIDRLYGPDKGRMVREHQEAINKLGEEGYQKWLHTS